MAKMLPRLIGDAGEHYIAFELSRRGVSVALLSTNTKGVDMLATMSGKNVVSIQVKASSGRNDPRTWAVGKHCPNQSENFFYALLNIWEDDKKPIECYIVPSAIVASEVNWAASMPQFRLNREFADKFKDNWNSLLAKLKG